MNWQEGHTRNYHSLGKHYVLLWKTGDGGGERLVEKDNAPVCASRAISFALLLGDLVADIFYRTNNSSLKRTQPPSH